MKKKNILFRVFFLFSFFGFIFSIEAEDASKKASSNNWLGKAESNAAEIIFYGKIVDQYDNPVSKAKVKLSISVPMLVPKANPSFEVETDGMGLFVFEGKKEGLCTWRKLKEMDMSIPMR